MSTVPRRDIKVALFCGGRGSASLVRELLRWPNISLTLLVNAYDDGLSTGALREFIPGMLGPSDFRKNLSYLLDLYSAQQYALQRLIEYRLPRDISAAEVIALRRYAASGHSEEITAPLRDMLNSLDDRVGRRTRQLLANFFAHADVSPKSFEYADCSFGNLIFAGAYLESGNFNTAAKVIAELLGSRARLVNVSRGESRSLVALKEDGTLLLNEAAIVSPQSAARIRELFFFDRPPGLDHLKLIAGLTVPEKEAWLRQRETSVEISTEAESAIREADIIIYGPGTQHSSLLPSYRIAAAALQAAPAAIKILTVNLRHDHDIEALSCTDLVDRVLHYSNDPENRKRVITHILYNRDSNRHAQGIHIDRHTLEAGCCLGARIIEGEFENPVDPRVHSGYNVVRVVIDLYENKGKPAEADVLDIYVDLLDRSVALEGLLQEFVEIGWRDTFKYTRLRMNRLNVPTPKLPDYLGIEPANYVNSFSEVAVLVDWLAHGDSEYLATLTGDGEYRLRDVLLGVNILRNSTFGAVYGSRNQSRRQFRASLNSAYGESRLLFAISWLGAFLLTALFGLRFRIIFSDPLTGFRIYKRGRLGGAFREAVSRRSPRSASAVTSLLMQSGVEISEIPVNYRTFMGFTRPGWRLWRGVRDLFGIVR